MRFLELDNGHKNDDVTASVVVGCYSVERIRIRSSFGSLYSNFEPAAHTWICGYPQWQSQLGHISKQHTDPTRHDGDPSIQHIWQDRHIYMPSFIRSSQRTERFFEKPWLTRSQWECSRVSTWIQRSWDWEEIRGRCQMGSFTARC